MAGEQAAGAVPGQVWPAVEVVEIPAMSPAWVGSWEGWYFTLARPDQPYLDCLQLLTDNFTAPIEIDQDDEEPRNAVLQALIWKAPTFLNAQWLGGNMGARAANAVGLINQLRQAQQQDADSDAVVQGWTPDGAAQVGPVFIANLALPLQYPIVDVYAFQAYVFLTTGDYLDADRTVQTFEEYGAFRAFVLGLAAQALGYDENGGLEQGTALLRQIDRALWAFGRLYLPWLRQQQNATAGVQ